MSNIAPAPEAQAPSISPVGRVVGTFFSPTPTFQSIAAKPGFLLPLIIWTAVSILIGITLQPRVDYDKLVRSAIEKQGRTLPEDQMQAAVERQKKISGVITMVFSAIGPLLAALLVTLVYWGAFKAFGWDFTFKQGLGVTTHGFLPNVLSAAILAVVLRGKEMVDPRNLGDLVRSNLGFMVDPQSQPVVHSLAQSIDLFSFWVMFLLVIGYSAAARSNKKGTAWGIVIAVWAVFVLGKAGLAAILPH
jgi:hypothetical protein